MIPKRQHWWQEMRSSFWFVPAVIVVGAVGLAVGLIAVDASVELHVDKRWPLIFGSGASGARGLLSSVAGSMITVAGSLARAACPASPARGTACRLQRRDCPLHCASR